MTAYAAAAVGPITAEPDKRVHYTLGLVLGVDEFQQDQFYHMAGRRWHNRLLHGYGTVWGLAVATPDPADADPEIRVTAGVAVDPCGREICVPQTMCVRLNGWLDRHADTLDGLYPGGTTTLPLAVVLCYRECPTDAVPIPGEPCRTQEDAMQPSRLQDSFELRLALREDALGGSPPGDNESGLRLFGQDHAEEAAVRALGELLRGIEPDADAPPGTGRAELLDAVRALAGTDSPPGSPPDESIVLAAAELHPALQEALRVWVTEVRPVVRAREPGAGACGHGGDDCCVLLAELDLPVTADWRVEGVAFDPLEDLRPVLLHTRLLQEWLLAGASPGTGHAATFATVFATATNNIRAWVHHPAPLEIPADAVTMVVDDADLGHPADVTRPVPGANVFDLPVAPGLEDDARVEIRFDAARIDELASPPRALLAALDDDGLHYADRQGDELVARTHYDQPGEDGGVSAHGDLTGLDADDHPQYLLADGSRALAGDLSADNHRITGLAPGASAGDAVRFDQVIRINDPAGGDLTGTYPDPGVARLRGRPVSPAVPQPGQVLTFTSAGQWQPQSLALTLPGDVVSAPVPGYSIVAAGFFARDGSPLGPAYNDLRAVPIIQPAGHYNLSFRGYEQPAEEPRFMYVLKGVAVMDPRREQPGVIEFVQFFREHIRIRVVLASGEPIVSGFMIEISRFEGR